MKFVLEQIAKPDIEPVTLAEMRLHLRCFDDVTADNSMIEDLIVSAREYIEDFTGRALIDQGWRLTLDRGAMWGVSGDTVGGLKYPPGAYFQNAMAQFLRSGEIQLRKSPVIAITSFVSVDSTGASTDIPIENYELREAGSRYPRIMPLNGATFGLNTLKIEYRAGFADRLGSPQQDASAVPSRYKNAIKLHVEAHYFRDERMMDKLIIAAESLVKSDRSDIQFA